MQFQGVFRKDTVALFIREKIDFFKFKEDAAITPDTVVVETFLSDFWNSEVKNLHISKFSEDPWPIKN